MNIVWIAFFALATVLLSVGYFLEVRKNSELIVQLATSPTERVLPEPTDVAEANARSARAASLELQNLRTQVLELQQHSRELSNSLSQTQVTRSQPVAPPAPDPEPRGSVQAASAAMAADLPGPSREMVEAHLCYGHLYQISLAVDNWARVHDGLAPASLGQLRDLIAPMLLICPSANPRSVALNWNRADPKSFTYRVQRTVTPWNFGQGGVADVNYVICPIHEIVLLNGTGRLGIPSKWRQ